MLVGLKGVVVHTSPTFVEIEVQGVVYGVHVGVQTSQHLQMGAQIHLHTTLVVKEDSHALYGFLKREEKNLFERLLRVSGVGPKAALAVLSVYDANTFSACIQSKDLKALQKVPGVGAKMAGKIMLDLAGFVASEIEAGKTSEVQQAILGLQSLGFKTAEATKICNSLPQNLDAASLIKLALQKLK
ncbi:Holliday junction branch migration protein RuvA [Helicobacter heilmannii]|uniref:Holliday junction branch migration complex subunit RuvA n=1 Tax=Helicobacter heilmannii TaxID=35817 RepID=A0A0K2XWM5_HELHE|nr:Holliday junction branch migration protein RuvA [Helicobacter heilmannii]CCM11400.1 Holliday junction DNA helicase RuvA [Helicobacter heilmannii ASB1.4]CRF45437.1 Holliday junction DNA helicase RuvA [Helicobacter heilmannii]CRF47545.1 Holliday junction DNA helicase RuvA [Helicobacter heilmannii]CRF49105.1 Holliday junction DNA helicase RuvA [Helicobacter heilmannii]CRF51053.1 Holliday junction DNA helicase RuvA [Helicobacter heilmannii]